MLRNSGIVYFSDPVEDAESAAGDEAEAGTGPTDDLRFASRSPPRCESRCMSSRSTDTAKDALECDDCNEALRWHLVQCRPMECPVVEAWTGETFEPNAAAMAAMLDAGSGAHGPNGCGQHRRGALSD